MHLVLGICVSIAVENLREHIQEISIIDTITKLIINCVRYIFLL